MATIMLVLGCWELPVPTADITILESMQGGECTGIFDDQDHVGWRLLHRLGQGDVFVACSFTSSLSGGG